MFAVEVAMSRHIKNISIYNWLSVSQAINIQLNREAYQLTTFSRRFYRVNFYPLLLWNKINDWFLNDFRCLKIIGLKTSKT